MQILSISSYRIDHRNVKLLFIQENVAIFSAPIVFALSVHAFAKNVNHFYVRNTLHAIVGQSFFPCFKYQLIDWWLGCYLSEVLTGLWIGQQQVRNLVPARSIFFTSSLFDIFVFPCDLESNENFLKQFKSSYYDFQIELIH